jgi:hypothetical protein
MHNEELAARYSKILSDMDFSLLEGSGTEKGLSGIFLSTVGDGYANAANKIMIVGCETAGWTALPPAGLDGMEDYIARSMAKQRRFLDNQLQSRNARGYTFHNFIRSVTKQSGSEGLVYANLFCFDWKRGSPMKHPRFPEIKRHSQALLKAQIDVLQPDTIIFANGMNTAGCRREYFPADGPDQVCTNGRDHGSAGIGRDHLWEFDLHGHIRCLRIHHPSARSKGAARAREFLIGLLPAAA